MRTACLCAPAIAASPNRDCELECSLCSSCNSQRAWCRDRLRHVRVVVQAQLIDYVVESNEPSVTELVEDRFQVVTGADGLAALWLPPGAQAAVQCLPPAPPAAPDSAGSEAGTELAADRPERLFVVSHRSEQFVAFDIFQHADLVISVREFGTDTPIAGVRVSVTLVEDERGEAVPPHQSTSAPVQHLETGADGTTPAYRGRAGSLVRADVVALPPEFVHMRHMDRVLEQTHAVRLVAMHTVDWQIPRKPSIALQVHDAASGERVLGVRYRVMVQPHAPPATLPHVSFGHTPAPSAVVRSPPCNAVRGGCT